ncbi:ribosome biogenesis GTPase YlqF [Qiania dongpingensis]|uniref:Ribosome biogenesis GTPase A n=1 Tax=Qiania dongpingensis TaxID=2763669 RepID=A0A7G9G548_9FIRM|nr:ribosome biogenesis GTPase YlqF [Qiania dongpingensis]QNM05930.1 ribosome biogenesis GTPase YlqF [Qiania dongpingensis]
MQVQWYPGHMTKARRAMQEDIKLVDLVIELLDARAPLSSRNPDIDELGRQKARLIILNKADLADARANKAWEIYFEDKGCTVVQVDARRRADMKPIQAAILSACREKIERDRRRGIKNRPVRAMVVGIPNVGKSTFINSYAGRACAKTGNRPGVTRGNQWIRLSKDVELLDTPGILWPKFEDQEVGIRLAMLGSIKDDILNTDELSMRLLDCLSARYPEALKERYQLPEEAYGKGPAEILAEVARLRNCLLKGSELDYGKAARMVIEDFRCGRLGRITLELPD